MGRKVGLADMLIALDPSRSGNYSKVEEAFLRQQWDARDNSFLLGAISSSDLRPACKRVLSELINGKLKRGRGRRFGANTDIVNASRALRVIDIEREYREEGRSKREAALSKASEEFGCAKRTLQSALKEFEEELQAAPPESLDWLRAIK